MDVDMSESYTMPKLDTMYIHADMHSEKRNFFQNYYMAHTYYKRMKLF